MNGHYCVAASFHWVLFYLFTCHVVYVERGYLYRLGQVDGDVSFFRERIGNVLGHGGASPLFFIEGKGERFLLSTGKGTAIHFVSLKHRHLSVQFLDGLHQDWNQFYIVYSKIAVVFLVDEIGVNLLKFLCYQSEVLFLHHWIG